MNIIFDWLYDQKLYILLLLATLFGYFWLSECKNKLKIAPKWLLPISVGHTLIGLLCVKFFAFLEGVPGGMSLFGAIFFLPAVYYAGAKLTKRSVADVYDAFTICTIFTIMCARINCLFAGCCLATVIPGTDGLRWPARTAEIIFYILLMIFLGKRFKKPEMRGKIYPLYMILYGGFRFVLEFTREKDPQTLFHLSHLWAVIAVVIGAFFYHRLSNKKKKRNHQSPDVKINRKQKGVI